MDTAFLKGKFVLIMGLGRFGGGVDAAKFVASSGAKVTVTDLANAEQLSDSISQLTQFPDIEFHLGGHSASDLEQADIVIVNPAVPPDNKFLQIAKQNNKVITSQIGIFFELCPAPIIGITGANGKSTTAALVAHLLKNARYETCPERSRRIRDTRYEKVWLSGNIGNEPLLTVIDQITPDDLVVLELSSFQIEQLAQIRKAPEVALLTNLTPNHLDRYGTFEAYCAAKENIFRLQKLDDNRPAVSIFNAEDRIGSQWFDKYKNDAGRVSVKYSADDVSDEIRGSFALPGRANLSNLAGALAIARNFGVDDEQIASCLPEFKPLPHRLELAAEINGVRWYNDSISTTPQSTIAALEAFDEPKILIAGGYDKNLPFDELGEKIAQKAKAAILTGQTANKIAAVIAACPKSRTEVEIVNSLAEAVECANKLAVIGDVVLLSPACASYDMFDNFEHRGQEFTRLVRQNPSG